MHLAELNRMMVKKYLTHDDRCVFCGSETRRSVRI